MEGSGRGFCLLPEIAIPPLVLSLSKDTECAAMTDRQQRVDGLRPLALPRPVRVTTDEAGMPSSVALAAQGGTPLAVAQVDEAWRIAEEWWRETPLGRTYYRVIVDGGRPITLFHDDLAAAAGTDPDGGWYQQRY